MMFRTPFLAAALLTGVAAVGLTPALAQTASSPAAPDAAQAPMRHHERMLPSQLVDGRVAFLKAELRSRSGSRWRRQCTTTQTRSTR